MDRRHFLKKGLAAATAATITQIAKSENTSSVEQNISENTDTVKIPAREVKIRGQYDVIVAGGGLAGVSAAVAAGQAGAKTLLIERNGFFGGVATAGMCSSVYNCFYTPSHELVVRGNSAIFANRLAQATGYDKRWRNHKGHIIFDLEKAKLVLTDLLEEAKVDYLFDTLVTDVVMNNNILEGLIINSKSGQQAIKAKAIVDSTGDADIASLAGAPCEKGTFPSSYCFRISNVDVDKFVKYFRKHPDQYPQHMDVDWNTEDALKYYKDTGTFLFPHGGAMQMDIIKKGIKSGEYKKQIGVHDTVDACQMHAIRDIGVVHVVTGFVKIENLDISQITRAMTDGKRMAYHVTDFFKKRMPGFEKCCVIATADDLGIRASRWIDGELKFTKKMKQDGVTFEDSIGKGIVEQNIVKHKGEKAWAAQVLYDKTYDIPYRCLIPQKVDGLLMGSGRSVSQENPFLLRVMAMTMVVGQAAGAAGAVAAKTGLPPRNVDIKLLQNELKRQGVNI